MTERYYKLGYLNIILSRMIQALSIMTILLGGVLRNSLCSNVVPLVSSWNIIQPHSFKTSVNFVHWPKQLIFNSSVSISLYCSHYHMLRTLTFIQSVNTLQATFLSFLFFIFINNHFSVPLNSLPTVCAI